jgi:group I intron endonuclease
MKYALRLGKSYIYSALLKHGYFNFRLEILEYCEPSVLLIREKYHIDLGSEYNIVKDPTQPPMFGRTHSDITKKRMSEAKIGYKHSDETKKKQSVSMIGKNSSQNQPNSQAIEVFDNKTNQTLLIILFMKLQEA